MQAFTQLLSIELVDREALGLDWQDLRRTYHGLFLQNGTPSALGVFGYACRLAPMISAITEAERAPRILDAGCGYGTESLLFAFLGGHVTAVELVPERVALARSRVCFFQDRASAPLSVRFVNANVVRYLEGAGPFDIVWCMESISHIHPLETFLPLAYERLSPGGLLIVSDPNALNPVAVARAWQIRGAPRYTLRVKGQDPATGEPVHEAVERILSVVDYVRRVRMAGFRVKQIVVSGFMASSLLPTPLHQSRAVLAALTMVQRACQAIPGLRLFGQNYTVVAQKDDPAPVRERTG